MIRFNSLEVFWFKVYNIGVKIILMGELSEPPSSITCFRDVTLYSSCFLKADVLVECPKGMRDMYYKWLKNHGAYDFVDAIVRADREYGFKIGPKKSNLRVDYLTAHNLDIVIQSLRRLIL